MICIMKVSHLTPDIRVHQLTYGIGEGHFEDASAKASGAVTPVEPSDAAAPKKGTEGRYWEEQEGEDGEAETCNN